MTSDASPRSTNSQVVSRLRMASSSRESSASWRPRPRVDSAASARGCRSWASAAPASAAIAAPSRTPWRRGRLRRREPAGSLEAREVVVEVLPAGHLVDVRLAVAVADTAQRVRREAQARRPPRRGARRSGPPRALPEVHPSRECIGRGVIPRAPTRRFRRRGRAPRRSTRSGTRGCPRSPRRPPGRRGSAAGPPGSTTASGSGPSRTAGHGPWSARRRSATSRRSGSRGRGRPTGVSSGSARVGTRSVSASQIGKSWITGALPSSGAPMDAICSASTR